MQDKNQTSPWNEGDKAESKAFREEFDWQTKIAGALLEELGYHKVFDYYVETCQALQISPSSAIAELLKHQASHIATALAVTEGMNKEQTPEERELKQHDLATKLGDMYTRYLKEGIGKGVNKMQEIQAKREEEEAQKGAQS